MRKTTLILLIVCLLFLNGCMVIFQKGRKTDVEKIQILESELEGLREARNILESRLAQEIKDQKVRLSIVEKGLVITFVAEVLFNSGKAKLKKESFPVLGKVIRILKETVPANRIGVEGHTDNEPIKYSRWKSNWELSSQRALGVVHYLEKEGVASERLSAIGYGEYQPVASNDTIEGMQLNRRVEIVILPRTAKEKGEEKYLEAEVKEELK